MRQISLFNHKDKSFLKSILVREGMRLCGASCISETFQNFEARKSEHLERSHKYELTKHLKASPRQSFAWKDCVRLKMPSKEE